MFNTKGSMGVVKDTRYIRCFWPVLDQPVALFAEGSSGIEVEAPPTPRNVLFPPGTVFLNGTRDDAFYQVINPNAEEDVPQVVRVTETVTIRGVPREVEYTEERVVKRPFRQAQALTRAQAEGFR